MWTPTRWFGPSPPLPLSLTKLFFQFSPYHESSVPFVPLWDPMVFFKSNLVLMFICCFHCSLGGNCMTSMIATCSLDRKNLDVSCIIIIVTVKYLSSTMFHCCTGMSVQFITNVASLRKTRRKHYELCHFDQDRIDARFRRSEDFLAGKVWANLGEQCEKSPPKAGWSTAKSWREHKVSLAKGWQELDRKSTRARQERNDSFTSARISIVRKRDRIGAARAIKETKQPFFVFLIILADCHIYSVHCRDIFRHWMI